MRILLCIAVATCALAAGAQEAKTTCAPTDKACALAALRGHPAKALAFWQKALEMPVERRTGPAPAAVVDLLVLDVIANGFPNRPRESVVEEDLASDFRQALAEIPEQVTRRVSPKLAGIYFADDIGGTGFTEIVRDSRGVAVAAFVVLDPSVLRKRTANEWATWKESSPFKPDARFALSATIEKPANDTRRQAIQYILLHELGHVLSAGARVHPDWNLAPANVPKQGQYPFFDLSWSIDWRANRYVTAFDYSFPERTDVVYYFGARLPGSAMTSVYEALERTSFPTLYAATHPADDFAESFASYVHTVMMGKPFEIAMSENGQVAKRYGSCWAEVRCAEKRRIIEAILH